MGYGLNNLKLYKFIKIKIMKSTLLVAYKVDCFNCSRGFVNVWRKKIPELMRGFGVGPKEFKDFKNESNKEIEGKDLQPISYKI